MLVFHCCFYYCFRPTFRYASGSFRYTCVLQILVLKDAIWCTPPPASGRPPFVNVFGRVLQLGSNKHTRTLSLTQVYHEYS